MSFNFTEEKPKYSKSKRDKLIEKRREQVDADEIMMTYVIISGCIFVILLAMTAVFIQQRIFN